MDSSDSLEDLVAAYADLRESGTPVTPESFADRHPTEAPQLLAALRRLEDTLSVFEHAEPSLPERIDQWNITGEIGRGAMGVVLRGAPLSGVGPDVAVKLLPLATMVTPRAWTRFRREAELLRRIDHPNIVSSRAVGVVGGTPYIVMDLIEGRVLGEIIQEQRSIATSRGSRDTERETNATLLLVAQLARAVGETHRNGVLHRDIKPANIMVTADGKPMLLDFGLAADVEASTLTATGDILGTPANMAPEQARGERADQRTDIYGLGAVLYELLTNEPVHAGDDSRSTLRAVLDRPILPVRKRRPDLPVHLGRVVHRALAYRRADRYSSADDLAADLEACARGALPRARSLGLVGRAHALFRFHRGRLLVGSCAFLVVVAGLLIATRVGNSNTQARRLSAAEDLASLAWLDGAPATAFSRAVEQLRAMDPEHRWLPLLEPLARGDEPPSESEGVSPTLCKALRRAHARRWDEAAQEIVSDVPKHVPDLLEIATLARAAPASRVASDRLDALLRAPPAEAERLFSDTATVAAIRGLRASRSGAHEEALAQFRRGASIQPSWPRFALHQARARRDAGASVDEAGQTAWEAGTDGFTLWARYLDSRGQRFAARAAFRRLRDEGVSPVEMTYRIAASFDRDHLLTEAEQEYLHTLTLDPTHVYALFNLAWMYAGLCGKPDCQAPHLHRAEDGRRMLLRALRADGGRSAELAAHVPELAVATHAEVEVLAWIQSETSRAAATATATSARLLVIAAELRRRMTPEGR